MPGHNCILSVSCQVRQSVATGSSPYLIAYFLILFFNFPDVDFLLGNFCPHKTNIISCRSSQIAEDLWSAINNESKLKIDENAADIELNHLDKEGIVIVERLNWTSSIIAINYAYSINADLTIVESLAEDEEHEVNHLIEDWRKGDDASCDLLLDKIYRRIGSVDFSRSAGPLLVADFILNIKDGVEIVSEICPHKNNLHEQRNIGHKK